MAWLQSGYMHVKKMELMLDFQVPVCHGGRGCVPTGRSEDSGVLVLASRGCDEREFQCTC